MFETLVLIALAAGLVAVVVYARRRSNDAESTGSVSEQAIERARAEERVWDKHNSSWHA